MDFSYALLDITIGLIVVYLFSAFHLFYLVRRNFTQYWNKSYPYGVMMVKAGHVPLFSGRFFEIGFATMTGHFSMLAVLFTSRFSDNKKIRLAKNIARILLLASLVSLAYLVFTLSSMQ